MPEALSAVFPETTLQTCIVHLIRNSLDYAAWDKRRALAKALKPIYQAINAEAAEEALDAFEKQKEKHRHHRLREQRRQNTETAPYSQEDLLKNLERFKLKWRPPD